MTQDYEIKRNLAYAYQILAYLGLDDHTYTHLSSRPQGADYYFIYPFGLRFEEVTPDNLLKVDMEGNILEGSEYQYNDTGYVTHSSIYKARPDLSSIFHLHTAHMTAVSAMKHGLLPITQWALHFYNQLSFHQYDSLVLDKKQQGTNLAKDLSDKQVMFLRNHGIIACGKTVHEALFYCYHLELACKSQCIALSSGAELLIPDEATCIRSNQTLLNFEQDLGKRDWDSWVRMIDRKNLMPINQDTEHLISCLS